MTICATGGMYSDGELPEELQTSIARGDAFGGDTELRGGDRSSANKWSPSSCLIASTIEFKLWRTLE